MKEIANYINGNCSVRILDDGTKIRTVPDDEPASPEFPETIDVKITNVCDMGCSYCHEQSNKSGKHGDINKLLEILTPLPEKIELALGGGNPLAHDKLGSFLQELKRRGFIANITVNEGHLKKYAGVIARFIVDDLIKGVGISYSGKKNNRFIIQDLLTVSKNIVFHLIAGVNKVEDIDYLLDLCNEDKRKCKILVLGYKNWGLGAKHLLNKNEEVERRKYQWYTHIGDVLSWDENLTMSFDNLAIEQLKLRRFFTDEAWSKFYMGDDGRFSMYIDAVKQEYARTSTSADRTSFSECGVVEYFQRMQGEIK